MQKVNRTYSDNGQLTGYTISHINDEMKSRARRYQKQAKRNQIIDTIAPPFITLLAMLALAGWYLINN